MSQLRTQASEIVPSLPKDRTFRFNELHLGLKGGEITRLRTEGWIERISRNSRDGAIWQITEQARKFAGVSQ